MEFSIKSSAPERLKSGAVVIGVFENGTSAHLSAAGAALDRAAGGALAALIRQGDVNGKAGGSLLLPRMPRIGSRVLLVGLGREAEFGDRRFREAIATAARALDKADIENAALTLSAPVKGRDMTWRAQHAVMAASEAVYRFDRMKSKRESRRGLKHLALCVERGDAARAQTGVTRGTAIAHGVALARDLGNLPGNVCTPTYLAAQARALAKTHKLKAQVLERRDMERLGMGSLLSVARGSAEPPKLIVLQYQGGKRGQKPVVLVGKGITFDTGGISIKPAAEMDEMKYDMCGAASVLGALKAAAELKLPLNIVGVIPSTENMPGGRATKPGDVATTMSGQTVEILNTDAEGRLILCDALTYAERFQPQAVVDIATLTGACVIALGHVVSGLFSPDDKLAEQLLRAGDAGYDRAWRLPVWDDYQELLHSNFADFANIGGRAGGAITAACFLARFTRKYPWAHLDIAGTAWKSGREKGGTGRPVPLLVQFLIERAGKA